MTTRVVIDGMSFSALPELCLFLLVTTDGDGKKHMGRTIYQKCFWQPWNAVRQNPCGDAPDRGWITVEKEQLIIPLE